MTFFSGVDTETGKVQLKIPFEEALKWYQDGTAIFRPAGEDSVACINGAHFDLSFPKLLSVSKRSIFVVSQVYVSTGRINPNQQSITFDHVNFVNSARDFSWSLGRAEDIGQRMVTLEIE